jgi:AraC-like DNA-binding protein
MRQWPADKVERKAVSSLVPSARNARTHSDRQVAQIAASIGEWGWTVPILVDETGGVIAGHCRIMAAQRLGISDTTFNVTLDELRKELALKFLQDSTLVLTEISFLLGYTEISTFVLALAPSRRGHRRE